MTDFVPILTTFNGGELSPLLDGRTDQDKYFAGCKTLENFIATVQGPARRRGGTRYRGATKANGKVWLAEFEFSTEQSYVLEFGDLYIRFWVNRAQLLSGPTPYEVVSPWTLADLTNGDGAFALRMTQQGDIVWITHTAGTFEPYKLSRLGATNWTLVKATTKKGPFKDIDPDATITVYASAAEGTVTLEASAALFRPEDVGTLFLLETENPTSLRHWQPDTTTAVGAVVRYEGNVYECLDNGASDKSGTHPPTQLKGTFQDGRESVLWDYLHSGYGFATITVYTDSTTVTAVTTSRFPDEVVGSGNTTTRWARAELNSVDGWPTDVAFFRSRLFYARKTQLFGSVTGDYDNFARLEGPDVTADTAIKVSLTADKLDALRWIAPVGKVLLAGAPRLELVVSAQTAAEVLSADNIASEPQTEYGANRVAPLKVDDAVLFLQRTGRKMREMRYSYEIERFKADDVSVLADHVLKPGVVDMAYQSEPDSIVWCVLGDGTLAALTYNRERGVVGWARHILGGGGLAESVAVIPSPDGTRDDVWLSVRRQIGGETVRYVEYMESATLYETGIADAFFVDSGITYDGDPVTTVTGLEHLEGEIVQILADGSVHSDQIVAGGEVTLGRAASKVHLGKGYSSRLQTMRLDIPANDGTTQSRPKSTGEITLRVIETVGGKVGPNFDKMDALRATNTQGAVGTPPLMVTGDAEHVMPSEVGTDGYVCVVQDQPLPFTLAAIVPRVSVGE